MIAEPLLEVRGLAVRFATERGQVQAVNGLNLTVRPGETLGLVGESGCGKSTAALALMRLLPSVARVRATTLRFEGRDLLALNSRELQGLRGNRIAMIFQNPMTSLDPSFTIGAQIVDVLREHRNLPAAAAREAAIDLLRRVGIAAAEQRFRAHPHQLSGGQRQRVVIAIALACGPSLLIADEPTTALDVTIQAQILTLLRDIGAERQAAMVLITHDLGVVARMCDRVAVMYAGRLVEEGPVHAIFAEPRHPYTAALLRSIPSSRQARGALEVIEGNVPDLVNPPPGCPFAPRCRLRMAICDTRMPESRETAPGHTVACFLHGHDHD
jgi:oligopeptide/dipeptide ABC transporter ATP-binding protein